jgi:hypothetical protein
MTICEHEPLSLWKLPMINNIRTFYRDFRAPLSTPGPEYFAPPPLAGLGFENTNGLWFVYKTKLTLEIKRTFKRHLEISKGPFTRAIFAAISVAIFYSFTSSKRRKSQLKSQQKSPV